MLHCHIIQLESVRVLQHVVGLHFAVSSREQRVCAVCICVSRRYIYLGNLVRTIFIWVGRRPYDRSYRVENIPVSSRMRTQHNATRPCRRRACCCLVVVVLDVSVVLERNDGTNLAGWTHTQTMHSMALYLLYPCIVYLCKVPQTGMTWRSLCSHTEHPPYKNHAQYIQFEQYAQYASWFTRSAVLTNRKAISSYHLWKMFAS